MGQSLLQNGPRPIGETGAWTFHSRVFAKTASYFVVFVSENHIYPKTYSGFMLLSINLDMGTVQGSNRTRPRPAGSGTDGSWNRRVMEPAGHGTGGYKVRVRINPKTEPWTGGSGTGGSNRRFDPEPNRRFLKFKKKNKEQAGPTINTPTFFSL